MFENTALLTYYKLFKKREKKRLLKSTAISGIDIDYDKAERPKFIATSTTEKGKRIECKSKIPRKKNFEAKR